MTYTTDQFALLAAIREHHDEDTPRLMYADCIQDVDPDRAELIRLQVEFVRRPESYAYNTVVRERELLANADRWRRGPVCKRCRGGGSYYKEMEGHATQCPDCHGTGDAGGLMRRFNYCEGDITQPEPVRVTYHRGMKRVECRAADAWERVTCPGCEGYSLGKQAMCLMCDNQGQIWRPTPWALAVCRSHPDVVEMWVDLPFDGDGAQYSWFKSSLPSGVFNLVMGHDGRTEDAARTALARAVVQWVHGHLKASSDAPYRA